MLHLAFTRSGLERALKARAAGDAVVALFPCVLPQGVLGARGLVLGGTITPSMLCDLILNNSPRIISWR
ncbi:MAG: hypothetical protein ACI4NA_08890 [Succinivibrio sp.]